MVVRKPVPVFLGLGLLLLAPLVATAQAPTPVVDLNTTQEQETIIFFLAEPPASLGGTVFFTADDGVHGVELWTTDGTPGGGVMLKDICPGACGSLPRNLTRVGSRLLFFAEDAEHGRELWATDGTAAGTSLVKDLRPGLGSGANTYWMFGAGDAVYFPGDDGAIGPELWKSDGTAAGTVLVKDLRPGPDGSLPVARGMANGTILLDADDGVHGREPWLTDGTTAGTGLLADVQPGAGSSTVLWTSYAEGKEWLATPTGLFLFQADDGTHGPELWASDGTTAGTHLVFDFHPGATGGFPFELTELAGTVYLTATDDTHGYELWRTDGTAAGTSLVRDISSGTGSATPREITALGGRLYFRASDPDHGMELWASDGTEAGTVLVKDIATTLFGGPLRLTPVGGQLLFFADDGTHGEALWKSDGTAAGTVQVSDFGGQAVPTLPTFYLLPVAIGDRLYFRAFDLAAELDLWASDGTAAGTVRVHDTTSPTSSILLSPNDGGILEPTAWGALGNQLLYLADDGASGNEPWASDGTPGGTVQLAEIVAGTDWSTFTGLTPLGNGALFAAGTLWATNGTPAGTAPLLPTEPSNVAELARLGGIVYFSGASTAGGQELWKSDGTAAGTVQVKDLRPGTAGSGPFRLTGVGSTLFFVANGGPGDRDQELWRSDGTAAGTVLVKDIRPGAEPSEADHLTAVAGRLFFTADDGTAGREPWVSDGTPAGTFRVKDLVPGAGSSIPLGADRITAALGGKLYFVANDGISGEELWESDGTAAGTLRVLDLWPGPRGAEPRGLTVAGGRLFFSADDGVHGRELWVSDGTAAGTRLAADLRPGAGSSLPRELAAVGNAVVFSADDGLHGVEPWASDGTWARRLGDLAPDALPSSPVRFTPVGNRVFFGANDGTAGVELWSFPQSALAGPLDFYTVTPCRLADTRPAAPLLANQPRTFPVAGLCGIPPEAKAVAVNLTVIAPSGPGTLIAWPTGAPQPATSSLTYATGITRTNNGTVELGTGGQIQVHGQTAANGQVHCALDVVGYFR